MFSRSRSTSAAEIVEEIRSFCGVEEELQTVAEAEHITASSVASGTLQSVSSAE